MNSKTWEFLAFLLWSAEKLTRPTFRNLDESFESWLYRKGFNKQLGRLEQRHLIERDTGVSSGRIFRLTAEGRLRALGGRDPAAEWARPWDGLWRMILFDVPEVRSSQRVRLRRRLRQRGLGRLQRSVWITPDPLLEEQVLLAGETAEVRSLILIEGRPCAGESDQEIAASAWDFRKINGLYDRHLRHLDSRPQAPLRGAGPIKAFRHWATQEQAAWLDALRCDPLLPRRILPRGYQGLKAWQKRAEVLAGARSQLETFRLP